MTVPVSVNVPAKLCCEKLRSRASRKLANMRKQSAGVWNDIWRSLWTYCPCSAYRTTTDHVRQRTRSSTMTRLPIAGTVPCLIPLSLSHERPTGLDRPGEPLPRPNPVVRKHAVPDVKPPRWSHRSIVSTVVPASVWARQQPTWQRSLPGPSHVAWLIRILESIHHP